MKRVLQVFAIILAVGAAIQSISPVFAGKVGAMILMDRDGGGNPGP
ncbi:hypothetical protein WDW37_07255 [Bdellovibrionota bacterium FG-1]